MSGNGGSAAGNRGKKGPLRKPSGKKPDFVQKKPVALFTAPGCSWCARAKNFLKRNGVRFRTIDVSTDKKALADCKRAGCTGVPVLLIGQKWICGYDEQKIRRELGLS